VAYGGVGPARRRLLHRRIAQAIELVEASDLDRASGALAVHLEEAGQVARALDFFERATRVALGVSATEEAIQCGTRALGLVAQTREGADRDGRELTLRRLLAGPLTAARGYAALPVEQNVERLAALETVLGESTLQSLWSRWTVRFVMGDLESALQIAEAALSLAADDPSHLCDAHLSMGGTLASLGELTAARRHFQAALASMDGREHMPSAHGSDLGVFTNAWFSNVLMLLGERELAREHAGRAIAVASRLEHPFSQALAYAYAALTSQLERDVAAVHERAETAIAICARYGFSYYGDWAHVLLGWARSQNTSVDEGIAMIEAAMDRLDTQRAGARRPYFLSLLAEAYASAGRQDRALQIVESALAVAAERHEACWTPALLARRTRFRTAPERRLP
jgi:tetratricopeptide (TPR) repeat protein